VNVGTLLLMAVTKGTFLVLLIIAASLICFCKYSVWEGLHLHWQCLQVEIFWKVRFLNLNLAVLKI